MTDIKLTQEHLKDAETLAEVEAIVNSALKLKRSGGHRVLNTLLTGYLRQHFNEDDPEVLDQIDEAAEFCEQVGRLLQEVERSHFNELFSVGHSEI